jgi:hypothetical protein
VTFRIKHTGKYVWHIKRKTTEARSRNERRKEEFEFFLNILQVLDTGNTNDL